MDFRWLKRCPDCTGLGLLYKPTRAGSQLRGERCARCAGLGWTPCPKKEIPQAEAEVRALLEENDAEAEGELAVFALPPPIPGAPSQTVVAKTKKSRRAQIRRSQAKPVRKTLGQVDIRAERPQTPLEAVALFETKDNPADPLAEAMEAIVDMVKQSVVPGSFAPDDLPPSLPPSLPSSAT